jgi:hypothetical protein
MSPARATATNPNEPGVERIENGGEVLHITPTGQVLVEFDVTGRKRTIAGGADTPHSTLAAQFVENELARASKDGKVCLRRTAPVLVDADGGQRPAVA